MGEQLPLCQDTVSVFYSPSRLGFFLFKSVLYHNIFDVYTNLTDIISKKYTDNCLWHHNNYQKCRSHYSNVQNKQQEQHLPVQQPQLADKNKMGCNPILSLYHLKQTSVYALIYPFTGRVTNHYPENGLSYLRAMEYLNVHIISPQVVALLLMQTSIYSAN